MPNISLGRLDVKVTCSSSAFGWRINLLLERARFGNHTCRQACPIGDSTMSSC
jgi:hypothetical protein